MEDGLRTIIEVFVLLIGAGGITGFITAQSAKRKIDSDAEAVKGNSF